MLNDEEERKKRLEEARNIIGNNSNISNSNNNVYGQKLKEANNIIGRINPSKTDIRSDNNISSTDGTKILYQDTIINNNEPSDILKKASESSKEEKKNVIKNNGKKSLGVTNTVTAINKDNNKATTDFRISNTNLVDTNELSENAKIASTEETENIKVLNNSDMYVLTGGEVDRRSNAEEVIDTVTGVAGNIVEGIADFVPSSIDFINSLEKSSIRKGVRKAYKILGYSEAEIERLTQESMDKFDQYSILSNLNNLMNNEYKESLRTERIQRNILKASGNPLAEMVAESAPSIGSNLVSMTLFSFNPILGTTSFIVSAGGSYLDDARARGMNDDQAIAYATVMGGFEGTTEVFITGNMIDKIGRAVVGKGISEEVLKSWGVSAAENFAQEAIMEPLQEATATVVGGNDKANWDDIGNRMLEAGISGVVSSIILGGASTGIASAENVLKKKSPTIDNYAQALVDTINSGKVDVQGIIQGAQEAIIINGGTQQFYTTTLNQEGNVESVQAVRGKLIENPNSEVNISPAIVRNSDNSYNVIDSATGILLDSTPYQSIVEAQTRFTDKMNNLDNATINNINNQVAKASIAVYEKLQEMTVNRIMSNDMQVSQENVTNIAQSDTNNVNAASSINASPTMEDNNQVTNIYQTSENQFRDDYSNNKTNYTPNTENITTNQNNGLDEVQKLMSQISYNSIYNKNTSKAILNNVSRNIPSIEVQETNNRVYLNSLDENGNIAYQQQIPNRPLRGIEIREIVNNAINNADLSSIQTTENRFRSNYSNEATNYMSENEKASNLSDEEIRNIVKYNQDGREISDEDYVDFLVERYKDNKNISGIITDTKYVESIENKTKKDKISDLYKKIQDKEFKIAKKLRNKNGELQNVNIDLIITKKGLNESFNKGFSNEKYAVVRYLDELIKTAQDGTIRAETKMRSNIMEWYYLYNTAEINGKLYGIKVDIKKTPQGDRFYVHRVNLVHKNGTANQIPAVGNGTIKINTVPFIDTSISQNKNSVKNNTNVNNKSMQNNENNTKNSNLRTSKASGEENIRKSSNKPVYNEQKDIQKELHNRIQNAILSKNSRKNTFLGTVSNKVASKIKSLFGIDVSGRNHIISDNDIRHMIKQHGNQTIEASRGQIAITTKDIEKIPDIIANYDSIEKGSTNKDAFTKQDFNTIRYKKQYSDNITYAVEVIPSSSNNLTIKTMWKKKIETNKKNNSSRVNHANNNIDLQNTPEAEPTLSYSSNSITQNKQNVKDSDIRAERTNNTRREDTKSQDSKTTYNDRHYEQNQEFMNYLNESEYLKKLMEVDAERGETNAHTAEKLIEQEIRKLDEKDAFDNSIPVTKLTDIDKKIEQYLKKKIGKGHFRERAYGIYKKSTDTIRVKEYKDLDNVFHELGHALDLGGRININKESLSNELLAATKRHGGYENESIGVQLDEGFAEILKTYLINESIVQQDYPNSYKAIETIKTQDSSFKNFIEELQQDTYNYIHQSPRNRGGLSNMSIGERTDRPKPTIEKIVEEGVKKVWDSNYSIKKMQTEFEKINGRKASPSENAYLLVRLASGVDNKTISMLTKGYVNTNGTKLMPGLNRIGEILGNDPERINDLRAYLVAKRDLEYKAKSLKTGIRTMDSKRIVEQFYNDKQVQEAAQVVYDTLDGVLQYAVNNKLITEETAKTLRESNAFYVPFQRVIEGRGNRVGRRGAVADIINTRTGSELDIKDVLENIVTNSANIIKQVENNNVLRAVYEQGQETGMQNNIFEEISAPMRKIGKEQLQTWEAELRRQGVDTSKIDLDKTIDLFVPNNGIVTEKNGSHIVSFLDKTGKRRYLEFYQESTDIFNALLGMDKNANSTFLKLMRAANMPLRYGATMANVGFAIPNMISDTIQATIYSEAGFVPVVDNIIGIVNVLGATNPKARAFLQHIAPSYVARLEQMYDIYQQTGASSSTRMSQYRQSAQELMSDVYGVKNSKTLGIDEHFVPLKRLMDVLTYIPELSESSTRFRVFQRNYEAYRNKGMSETDARIAAAIESRDATQDFGRTGTVTHEVNQLIPFSAARVGSAYTFTEKVKANPKRVLSRTALLITVAMLINGLGNDDEEIEELNQRKKDDNFVFKVGDTIVTLKKPQGILRSVINLAEYIQDLFTGHIEEGKEGERLVEWTINAIMDNMPADSVTGLVPNAFAPLIENAINKDFYYNTDIVKSYDLDLPEEEQYYDYTSQLAIWLGKIFHQSPAKIDNLISGYFGSLGTQFTNIIDWISGKLGISVEEPAMGAEDNAIGKRFVVNVNENSASVDEIYNRKDELTKKLNGGTITEEENEELENIEAGISKISALNKQVKAIKQDKTMSGTDKADAIRPLQQLKTDVARQSLGKDTIYTTNTDELEALEFYPSRNELSYNGLTLNLTEEMKTEYMNTAYELYKNYTKQGLYSEEYLEKLKEKVKDVAKKTMLQKYKNQLVK